MLKKYLNPEYLFLISGILIAVFRFLHLSPAHGIAVNHYIVLDSTYATAALLILFAFFSLPYTLFRKAKYPLSQIGGWIHYFLTILPFILAAIMSPVTRRYYIAAVKSSESMDTTNIYFFIEVMLILFAIGQFVFFVNMSVGLMKLIRKRNRMDEE